MCLIIYELLVIAKIHFYLLLRVSKVLKTNKLRAEMSYQLYYSLPRALFFENSCSQVSGLFFMFVCASTLSKQWDMHFLGATRPAMCFFSCEMAKNTTRNVEVCEESLHPVFNSEKKPTFEKNLPVRECNVQALFSLYFSYVGCFYQLMVCSCGCRNIQA